MSRRVAISLSNHGVALLERGAFLQAYDTTKDAISMIQLHLQRGGRNDEGCSQENERLVHEKIDRASKYLAANSRFRDIPSTLNIKAASHDGAFNHADTDTIIRFMPSASFAVPIRLDHPSSDTLEERDPELDAAVILHNFGVAQFCLSRVESCPITSRRLGKAAICLFEAARSTIHKHVSFSNDETEAMIEYIVLSHLVQAQLGVGKVVEANECYQKMGEILEEREAILEIYVDMDDCCAAAA